MAAQYVSTKEIAAHYGVHPKTVLKWVRSHVIPAIRVNQRHLLFDIQACDAAMNRRTILATV